MDEVTNIISISYIPYVLVLFIGVIAYVMSENVKLKMNSRVNFIMKNVTWISYFLLSAFRGNGNGDYFNYLAGIPAIDSFSKVFFVNDYPFEIGFRLIAYINNLLFLDGQFTMIIMSGIIIYNIKSVIDKYSKNIALSWLLYFPFLLMFDMHHTRNAVAMSFVVKLFFELIVIKNTNKSILFSILALSFHKSSLYAIVLIYIYFYLDKLFSEKIYDEKNQIKFITVLIFLSSIFNLKNTFTILNKYLGNVYFIRKIFSYLSNDRWSYKFSLLDPRFILLIITVLFIIIVYKRKTILLKKYIILLILAISTVAIFSDSTILTIRLYSYFNVFMIFLIPEAISINNYNKIMTFIVVLNIVYFCALISKQVPYYIFF